MKAEGLQEGCIEQIHRLFNDRLYLDEIPTDGEERIRIDDWEMKTTVQDQVAELWEQASTETLPEIGDLDGYTTEFFNLFGFKVDGVDYSQEADEMTTIPSIQD